MYDILPLRMTEPGKHAALRAAVVEVIERSATFEERVAAKGMIAKPSSDDEVLAICRAVQAMPRDMRIRGTVSALFARLYATDALEIPAWATALESLLSDPSAQPDDELALGDQDDHATRGLANAFSGFLRTASAWLDGLASQTRLTPAARSGLLRWLRRAWTAPARAVLITEGKESGAASLDEYLAKVASRAGWLGLLATYPVLGRLLGSEYELWQRECRLLLERLASDWTALGQSGDPTLVELEILALKRPPTSAPPLLVTLANGRRVVYQGKDLRIVVWFNELVAELGRAGLSPTLAPLPLLAREHHAWVDFIEPASCTDSEQVGRYFTRVGMYLRLFQALGSADMHGRNLLAVGEHPVFIDLETLLQPPRASLRGTRIAQAARDRYDASPLSVSLLPLWLTGAPGSRAVNIGGLNRGGMFAVPNTTKLAPVPSTMPTVADKTHSPGEYLPQLVEGYRAMSAALATSDGIRAHLARAAELRIAVLWRSYMVHKPIADTSVVPLLLTDGRLRDAFLTRLVMGLPDERSFVLGLDELRAIREGAYPSFSAQPGNDAIFLADGTRVPGAFATSALERVTLVRDREDTTRDLDTIVTAIGCEALFHNDPPPPPSVTVTTAPPAASDAPTPLAHAVAIGDFLLEEAVVSSDGMMWVGAAWLPMSAARRIDILPADLLSGSAGIAVVLAYLARRTNEVRFRDAARLALAPIQAELVATLEHKQFAGGAFIGVGAQFFALGKCAELLRDDDLHAFVIRKLSEVPSTIIGPSSPRDVVLGTAGLLLVAANLLEPFSRPANLGHIADDLRRHPANPHPFYAGDGRWAPGLPSEDEGIAWGLSRWYGVENPAVLPSESSLLTHLAIAPKATPLDAMSPEPVPSLDALVLALAARDARRDRAISEHARAIANAIVSRRKETGRWLEDSYVAERHHLSALTGLGALALAFARIDAPELPCCARLVY